MLPFAVAAILDPKESSHKEQPYAGSSPATKSGRCPSCGDHKNAQGCVGGLVELPSSK